MPAQQTTIVVMTQYGKTALASAIQGNGIYTPPLYLVLENNGSTLQAAPAPNPGASSIITLAPVHLSGDTQIVLGAGLPTQEVVTFTAATGAGPTTYTLSGVTANSHAAGDPVCRVPLASDTMTQIQNEIQYDSTNAPGLRLQSVSGYTTGPNEWTMQFYLTGIEASSFLMMCGISDSPSIGQGNLHAHMVLGTNHVYVPANGGVDLEIDIPLLVN